MAFDKIRERFNINNNTIGENSLNLMVEHIAVLQKENRKLKRENRWIEKLSIWWRKDRDELEKWRSAERERERMEKIKGFIEFSRDGTAPDDTSTENKCISDIGKANA